MVCAPNHTNRNQLYVIIWQANATKTLESAKVKILGKDEVVYESKDLFKRADKDRADTINELINKFGEEVYV